MSPNMRTHRTCLSMCRQSTEAFESRFPMTGSAEPTRRAGQGYLACETASTHSAGRYRWPAPPRGPPSSLSFR